MDKETKKALGQALNDRITERVEKIRAARGWSVRDMAPRIGMTSGNLGHKLRGATAWSLEDIAAIQQATREKLIEVV